MWGVGGGGWGGGGGGEEKGRRGEGRDGEVAGEGEEMCVVERR